MAGPKQALCLLIEAMLQLALFDLDETLIPLDSDYAWGEFATTLGWTDAEQFRRANDAFYEDYVAGQLDIDAYVYFATQVLREQEAEQLEMARERFMQEVIEPAIHPAALALVRAHQQQDDAVAIITATNEWVTAPIAQRFGIDELIAVRLQRDAAGRYTGTIAGVPSFGAGKVTRVEKWLAARGRDWTNANITFYSDSFNDLPLLERVQTPVATNPDARLRAEAQRRGWRVLELFTPTSP